MTHPVPTEGRRMAKAANCYRAVSRFGEFCRSSNRVYVAAVVREDGWHQFSMSAAAAEREADYQRRKGHQVDLVPVVRA